MSIISLKDIYDIAKDLGLISIPKLFDKSYILINSRRNIDYEKILKGANNFIYCLGLTWRSFCSSRYEDIFLSKLLNPIFQIKILLLDPKCPIFKIRANAKIYKESKRDLYSELSNSLNNWKNFYKRAKNNPDIMNLKERFNVKLYCNIPFGSILIIDNIIYFGFYFQTTTGGSSPFLLVKNGHGVGGLLYKQILNNFNLIWTKGKTIFTK